MILIHNGTIVNDNNKFEGYIIISGELIHKVARGRYEDSMELFTRVIDAQGGYIIPGVIDDQVHFREPGLTSKADISSESRAAVAGGVTSYMEMPNTNPSTTTLENLEWKFQRAAECSWANYSFYFGASNSNASVLETLPLDRVCGVKVFMGSSTGDMLVDREKTLSEIFQRSPLLVAVHCEDNATIKRNLETLLASGVEPEAKHHPIIRDAEACYLSSAKAVELATKFNTRLHLLHLSTQREMTLLSSAPLLEKRVTGEVCVHHLWFSQEDYATKGNLIKWNPAIKSIADRDALREALQCGKLDIVATDHAPHTLAEKMLPFMEAPSGGPLVQFSLLSMLQMCNKIFTVEQVVQKMCHNPALLFQIEKRGFIKEGYYADIVIVDTNSPTTVTPEIIVSKCGWSPMEGYTYRNTISQTIINGEVVYDKGYFKEDFRGKELKFNR